MRPITLNPPFSLPQFNALLASREFAYAEAFTLRFLDGTNLFYTDAQEDFTVPPCDGVGGLQTYDSDDVLISGLKFKVKGGGMNQGGDPQATIEVDQQTATFFPNANTASPSLVSGVPFLTAVVQGRFDGATIQRDRWFFNAPGGTPVGGMPIFYGIMGAVESQGRTQAKISVKADLALLNLMMPRNLYQPNCQYTVYSGPCGAVKSSFAVHDVVGASPSFAFIPWTSATAQYVNGEIMLEAGPAINQTRTIRAVNPGVGLYLSYPLYDLPLAGDAFVAYPGCDRQYAGGCAFFSRQAAFRATEFVPQAEMAV